MNHESLRERLRPYFWSMLALAVAIGFTLYWDNSKDSFIDKCPVTKEWFEEAFGWEIEDKGKNYEIRNGYICITNDELLKEIYGMVKG